jgi:hypothetical protein
MTMRENINTLRWMRLIRLMNLTKILAKLLDMSSCTIREFTELLKIVVFTLLWYHPPPRIPPRLSIGAREWWTHPGSTFCSNNTSAMEKKYMSRYRLVSWKMGCACVFATSNILVMYVLVSKHGKHLLLFEAGAILISDQVMAGWGQVQAVLLACLRWFTLQGVGLGWW